MEWRVRRVGWGRISKSLKERTLWHSKAARNCLDTWELTGQSVNVVFHLWQERFHLFENFQQNMRRGLIKFIYWLRFFKLTLFPSDAIFGSRRCVSASVSSWPKWLERDIALCFVSWWRLRKLALRSCSSITRACSRSLNRRPRNLFCMSWKFPKYMLKEIILIKQSTLFLRHCPEWLVNDGEFRVVLNVDPTSVTMCCHSCKEPVIMPSKF